MRCTKCSFISFDDLSTCAKCASDLSRLSKELNGTCTETRQEFFLGTAIQTGIDDDNFSDSQVLPPIDHSDMNFDDTSTGGFSPLSSSLSGGAGFGFDDSVNIAAEDDVAIELGDIMPIDFEQLDSGSVLSSGSLEHTDSLALDDFSFDFDKTDTVSPPASNEIDLDLTAGFDDAGSGFKFDDDLSDINIADLSGDLQVVSAGVDAPSSEVADVFSEGAGFDLDQDLFEQLADASGSFDETTSLNADGALNETQVSLLAGGDEYAASLELDESLVAELARPSSQDVSGEFPMDFAVEHSASGDFELDPALVAELASGDEPPARGSEDVFSGPGNFSDDTVGFDRLLELERGSSVNETLPLAHVEDLTGDFPPIREDDDTVLSGLDLADIDVSDLLDTSASDISMAAADVDGGTYSQQNLVPGQSELNLSVVDDAVRAKASSQAHGDFDQIDDDDVMEFGGGLLGEELEGIDDMQSSGSDIDDLADEIDLLEGAPQDFNSLSLDDTFRESESAGESVFSMGEDSSGDILDDELVVERSSEDLVGLSADIEGLALGADFEAFLNKTATVDRVPEIDLISDDDDDGPPDLPS